MDFNPNQNANPRTVIRRFQNWHNSNENQQQ